MKMHILVQVQLFHILKSHTHLHSTGTTGYKNTYLLTQTYKFQKMSFGMQLLYGQKLF